MAEPKYTTLILETIDQLRKRKARPDLERISHMLERRHGVSPAEVEADLEKLVDGEIVIKVDYKGSTSYRNAAKWRRSHLGGHVLNSSDTSQFLSSVVRALCDGQPTDVQAAGVGLRDVEQYIVQQKPDSDLCTKGRLLVALQREVDVGSLRRLPNGSYVRGVPGEIRKSASKPHIKTSSAQSKAGVSGQGKVGAPYSKTAAAGKKSGQTSRRKVSSSRTIKL